MIIGISFITCNLIYLLLLCIAYFLKKKIKTVETEIYAKLLILNVIGLILELACCYTVIHMEEIPITNIIANRLYLIYFSTFISLFTMYVYIICCKHEKIITFNKIEKAFITIIYAALILCVTLLPLKYYHANDAVYSYGEAVDILTLACCIYMLIDFICIFKNLKKLNKKKIIPIFALLICFIFAFVVRQINPGIILITCSFTLVTAIMFFTIENPDMKTVEELTKNRKLTENNFEEKSNFLFKISQDLKQPLKEMTDLSQAIINKENIEENAKEINLNSRQLYTYVNDALDVSQIDIKNLKILESIYNSKNFFEEINKRVETEIKNQKKDIEYRYNITKNLPEHLSGDNIKIKQIILSILFNSIKYTKKGFVELNVNSIIKYGICRLIIDISDSGGGISIDKINNVLSSTGELTKKELDKIDTLNIDLPLVHKMIKVLNGNFIIKSEKNLGTHFSIIIDQKIENKKIITKEYAKENKKILLISENEILFNTFNKISDEIDIEQSFYLRDALEKLEEKEIRCILIDDKLKEMNALSILRNLNTEIPSIIIIS